MRWCFRRATEDVQDIVRLCAAHRVPVIAFGTGTSLEGQVNAPRGGICLDFRDMNRVLAVHAEDLDCVIEPGITRKQLNEHLRDRGVFFPIDPGADASLGGMAATRASGTNAVRYGTMKDNVLALKVVLANGEVDDDGAAGEEILGRLRPDAPDGRLGRHARHHHRIDAAARRHPGSDRVGVCPFPSVEAACNATILTIQSGIPVARIELLDALQVRACNLYSKLVAAGNADAVSGVSRHRGQRRRTVGAVRRDRQGARRRAVRLGDARRGPHPAVAGAARRLLGGARGCGRARRRCRPTFACRSRGWRNASARPSATPRQAGFIAPIVGHVGDGNFHMLLLVDLNDADEIKRAEGLLERLVERALAMDGTCTGEHGIGQGKMKYLKAEHGEPALATMRAIKRALDPLDIINPGKIFSV